MSLDHEVIVGKNVIGTLTVSMYDNSLFLFREYIQNSADAIDAAVRQGILAEGEGQIEIVINAERRFITFEDNGTGIASKAFKPMLANIGNSIKDRKTDKGFRGIGRLGGLGYCKKVRFETSVKGEAVKNCMEFDARNLHEILENKEEKISAEQLINRITSTWEERCESEKHYFKVSLIDVNSTNGELLDTEEVRRYLSMVAPVAFDAAKFRFVDEIEKFLRETGIPKPCEYCVNLNGHEIRKAYTTSLKVGEGKGEIEVLDVVCRSINSDDGKALGWYWFCVSKFEGVLPKKCYQRGIRLRKANIQIGDADCLTNHPKRGTPLWKEDRGNTYFLGEIHVLDENLIPNSRRDYFDQDEACRQFENALSREFLELHNLYHYASDIRSEIKKINDAKDARKAFEKKERTNAFYDDKERKAAVTVLNEKTEKAYAAQDKLARIVEKQKSITGSKGEKNPIESIISGYNTSGVAATKIKETESIAKKAENGYAKDDLSQDAKRVLDIVFKVLENTLPPSEVSVIREEILKKVRRR